MLTRKQHELLRFIHDRLREDGVRTPVVVAARARAAKGSGRAWELDLVTECVEGTTDLGYVLGLVAVLGGGGGGGSVAARR